jgi:hypothetical protein
MGLVVGGLTREQSQLAALQQRSVLHVRVLDLNEPAAAADSTASAAAAAGRHRSGT